MLASFPLPNKPPLLPSPLHPSASLISDYGIQVDFPTDCDGLSCEERRKLKKKQARKRRKEKSKEAQRQARRQIATIVQEFYSGDSTFLQREAELEALVEVAYSSDFHDFLDEMIRSRVALEQRQIWEYTQQILEERHFQREEVSFYRLMVLHIYSRWRGLQSASAQIEPMINIYLKYSYPQRDEELTYRNLALNTFNYMLDTDDTLKVPPRR